VKVVSLHRRDAWPRGPFLAAPAGGAHRYSPTRAHAGILLRLVARAARRPAAPRTRHRGPPRRSRGDVREGGDAGQRRTHSACHDEEARSPLLSCPAAAEEERARGGAWQGISRWLRRRPALGRERRLLVVEGAVRCGTEWRDPAVGVLPRQRRDFVGGEAPVAEQDRQRRRSPCAEEQRRRRLGLLRLCLLVLMQGRAALPGRSQPPPSANQGD
jgi:hypothetical protein